MKNPTNFEFCEVNHLINKTIDFSMKLKLQSKINWKHVVDN